MHIDAFRDYLRRIQDAASREAIIEVLREAEQDAGDLGGLAALRTVAGIQLSQLADDRKGRADAAEADQRASA